MKVTWKAIVVMMVFIFSSVVISGIPAHGNGQSAVIEPEADGLLRKMSTYMASLEQFSVQTENTLEVVLRSELI